MALEKIGKTRTLRTFMLVADLKPLWFADESSRGVSFDCLDATEDDEL